MKPTAFILIMLAFSLLPSPSTPQESGLEGILVRPQQSIETEEDIDSLVNLCETYSITHVFLMVKQDTGPESGLLYYNSAYTPRASDFDILHSTLEKAHQKNIKVYAWLPLLYDRWASEQGLGLRAGEYWISPLKAVSYFSTMVSEIKAYGVDGILFDYLWFPDDFAASEQLKSNFGEKFGYDVRTIDLSLEKERNTPLWHEWISYRNEVLADFLKDIMPEDIPVGVTVIPQDILDSESEYVPPTLASFVTVQIDGDPTPLVNKLTLLTKADVYVTVSNDYVSDVRQQIFESTFADMLIFSSEIWDESAFKRIKKAEVPFTDIRMTRLPFIDYYNNSYDMRKWKIYEINTVVIPSGHVFSTYFKYTPYKEKWSLYTEKFDRDYVEEMIQQAREIGLYAVLQIDIQSEEYVVKYPEAASITFRWEANRKRVCLSEISGDVYKQEFFEMAKFLADNYEAEALLITNISYLEDCFCIDCLESYIDFMAEKGVSVEDWPRTNGEIDIYNQTVGEWKTHIITEFLGDLREYLRNSNKELWVDVPVSANLEYSSSEYGLYLPDVEKIVDRIVLTSIDITNPPRTGRVARSLTSRYILSFYADSVNVPAREYVLDSLRITYENQVNSVGINPHSAMTDSLWGAFYIAYAYRLALTSDALMEIYNLDNYEGVISTYFLMAEERNEEERQNRENARNSIQEAEKSYSDVLITLEDAKQIDLDITSFEITIEQNLALLSDAKNLFVQGDYLQAERKGKTVVIEFSTLAVQIEKMVSQERIDRVTSGISIVVVFLLIMMYVRFTMRKRKK
ncbi:MAG: hypothetical protein HXS44_05625 [Theionarchaea archaeon]|nr:hypothetical protein [Theionarchaea archaeon]